LIVSLLGATRETILGVGNVSGLSKGSGGHLERG
jgi:hypothetical protein